MSNEKQTPEDFLDENYQPKFTHNGCQGMFYKDQTIDFAKQYSRQSNRELLEELESTPDIDDFETHEEFIEFYELWRLRMREIVQKHKQA